MATMAQVAAELDLAKPTLYKLSGSKDELLQACVDAETERLNGHLDDALLDIGEAGSVSAVVDGVLRYAADSPGGFALLFERRGAQAGVALERVETRLAELLDDQGPLAAALLGAASAVVSRTLRSGGAGDARALGRSLTASLAGKN